MKLSDYVVAFFLERGIKDFFGYQGTMIAHLIDSIGKHGETKNHSCYNEQSAAFAACGYAIATGGCGVAYATSGPGAINLVSGVANAYYDSTPVIFITGQINTYEYRDDLPELRQNAFQETKIIEIVRPVTKYAVQVRDPQRIRYELEKAYYLANEGRKGPVLLDLPMNVQRAEIDVDAMEGFIAPQQSGGLSVYEKAFDCLKVTLEAAERPVLMLGNGIAKDDFDIFVRFAEKLRLPIVTSLLAKGRIPYRHELNFGYLGGAYGHRYANMIAAAKADQLIAVGMSLCTRQTGTKVAAFAPEAKILRYDIDPAELRRKIKEDETSFQLNSAHLAQMLREREKIWSAWKPCSEAWVSFCKAYRAFCQEYDNGHPARYPNHVVSAFNAFIGEDDIVVSDVGQHMMWVAQSTENKASQPVLFSGGHGAMGFALPAAIGAATAYPEKTVFCFCGDGAFQMNMQELQWVYRAQSNVVMIVLNNQSLGLITQQQDAYFGGIHHGAAAPYFTSPNFKEIAAAYGIDAVRIDSIEKISEAMSCKREGAPLLIEYVFNQTTRAYPKTALGEAIYNQEPLLPQDKMKAFLNDPCTEA